MVKMATLDMKYYQVGCYPEKSAQIPMLKVLAVVFVVLTVGCSQDPEYKRIDFSEKVIVAQPVEKQANEKKLRVAVAAMISPKETFTYYRKLLDYIGAQLDLKVQLVQRKTYGEINELFAQKQIDLGFICSGPYAAGDEKYGFEVLAIPQVNGSNFYQSYLIVHQDSRFQKLEDLRGRVFAFTDPESNTGRLVPVYWLLQQRETPDTFFKKSIYTYSHDNSIMAVSKKLVDGAAIDGHIWEYYNRRNPDNTSGTRIIKKSDPFGNPPVVASAHIPEQQRKRIRQVLFSLHLNPNGKKILTELMIDRFIAPEERWYDPIRRMKQTLSQSEGPTHANAKPQK
jgi:phosphonate transport system substrate-binding protein